MDQSDLQGDVMPPYQQEVSAGFIAYLGFDNPDGPKIAAHFLYSNSTDDSIGFVHLMSPDTNSPDQFITQLYPVTYSKAAVGAQRIADIVRQLRDGFWIDEPVTWVMLPFAGTRTTYGTALGEYCATIDKQSAASMRACVSFFAERNGLVINAYKSEQTPASPGVMATPGEHEAKG